MQRADLLLLLALGACAMMLLSACESASIGDPGGALDPNGGGSEYQAPGMGDDKSQEGNEPTTPLADAGTMPPGPSTLKDAGGTASPADDAAAGAFTDPGHEGEADGFPAAEDAGPDTREDIVMPSDADDTGALEDGEEADDAEEPVDADEPDDVEGTEDAGEDAGEPDAAGDAGEDVETDAVSGATPM